MNEKIKPLGDISEFISAFSDAQTPKEQLLLVARSAANDGKTDGVLFNEALEIFKNHLMANSGKIIPSKNELMQLRSEYLDNSLKTNTVSSWNKIEDAILRAFNTLQQKQQEQ